jgi:tetrapyrrole methylase family protein / MazG family protein
VTVGRVLVAGLGPAGPGLLSGATLDAIERVPHRFLRTSKHPAANVVADATSFDSLYETAEQMEQVYVGIVDALATAAAEHGEVLYLVPGSPLVAERTVVLLRDDQRVEVEILPALSYLDLAWAALGIDPLAAGVRLVDGRRFAEEAAGERGPLLVAQVDSRLVLSEVKLAVDEWPAVPVTVLQRLGLPDERVFEVSWPELDRSVEPDHLTTLWIPSLEAPVGQELVRFHELVRTLREQCPWDREQTHASLTRHLLEESYEVLEAIEAYDPRRARVTTTSARSWATCCSRWSSTPPSPSRRAASRWPTWRGASTTSSCAGTRTCSGRWRPRPPSRCSPTGSRSSRPRRAMPR